MDSHDLRCMCSSASVRIYFLVFKLIPVISEIASNLLARFWIIPYSSSTPTGFWLSVVVILWWSVYPDIWWTKEKPVYSKYCILQSFRIQSVHLFHYSTMEFKSGSRTVSRTVIILIWVANLSPSLCIVVTVCNCFSRSQPLVLIYSMFFLVNFRVVLAPQVHQVNLGIQDQW